MDAAARWRILRLHVEDEVPLARLARESGVRLHAATPATATMASTIPAVKIVPPPAMDTLPVAKSGNQPGDPTKAAQALLRLVEAENPPVRLFLGEDALALVDQKLDAMKAEIGAWEALSRSTSFAA